LAGVLAALGGAGAWAPVTQQCVTSVAGALALFVGAGLRLQLRWQWEPVRALLSIGLPLTASTLAQHARYRLFALLIGGSAGAMALGEVHVAFRLVDTVRELSFTALWRLMLPILSERQNERAAMLAAVDRLLDASTLVMLPLCGALVLTVGPVVALLLGPGWAASGLAALPLVGLMAALAITFPSGVALVAVGKAHYALFANLAGIAATIAGVLLIAPATPLAAVLVWCGAHAIVIPYALWANARALGVGPLRPLREAVPMLAVAATAVLVALQAPPVADTPVSLIALRLFKGGLVVAAFLILRKWGPSLATLHNLVQPLAPARVPGASRRPTLFPSSAIRSTVAENHAGENEPCAPPMPSSRS
jgi:PST family polysaccharide transporter